MRVLLAGGGTAGHTSPLLATADALRRLDPGVEITCLGTPRGLETRVVPEAGYPLELIPPVPLPRRPERRPAPGARPGCAARVARAARRWSTGCGPTWSSASAATSRCRPTSPPAARRLPLVVHEGNALPGLANKLGARFTDHVATSFPDTAAAARGVRRAADPPDDLDARPGRAARRGAGRPSASTPTGRRCWSPAARRARAGSTRPCSGAAAAPAPTPASRCCTWRARTARPPPPETGVARTSCVRLRRPDGPRLRRRRPRALPRRRQHRHRGRRASGLPAVFVPLPIGNGEQALNARAGRRRRGRRCWSTTPTLTPDWVADHRARRCSPTRRGSRRWARPRPALIPRDADEKLARIDRSERRPDEGPGPRRASCPPTELGRVHFVGIGGAGLSGHRPDHGAPAASRSPAATTTTPRPARRCASSASPCHLGHDAAHVGDADTLVVSTAVREDNPEVRRGAGAAACGSCPARPALQSVMAGRRVARGRRHPRQDHDHLAADRRRCSAAGADPTYADRRRCSPRPAATPTTAAATCSWPRPTRATAPSWSTARTPRSSPTSRPTTSTTGAPRRPTARRSTSSSDRIDPAGFSWSAASTTPAPPTLAAVARGPGARRRHAWARTPTRDVRAERARVRRRRASSFDGQPTAARRSAGSSCRSRAATTSSTRSPRSPSGCGSGFAFDDLRARARGVHRHRPADGAQGRGRAECGSTTATPTTRPRSPATSRRPGRWPATGALVVAFQPHLVSRTRIFGAAMGEALGAADEVVVLDVYVAREDARPGGDRPPGRRRRAAAGRAGALRRPTSTTCRAELVRLGPARRPGAHPRRRQRHRGRARGARAAASR